MVQLPQFKAILSIECIPLHHLEEKEREKMTKAFLQTITELIKSFRGDLIHHYFTNCICFFPSVFEGILASIELKKAYSKRKGISFKTGLHYGPVDSIDGFVNQDVIHITRQIQLLGDANSVVISQAVSDQIKSHPQFKSKPIGKFEIDGLPGLNELFILLGFGLSNSMSLMSRIKASIQNAAASFIS